MRGKPAGALDVAFVGNYLPRNCGIATFTYDLAEAAANAAPQSSIYTVAINDPGKNYIYPTRVEHTIREQAAGLPRRPSVFFEEWFDPIISGIQWVSELIVIAGGDECFPELSAESLAKNRIIADPLDVARRNPDIVLGSWCGRKFRPEHVFNREGWENVPAVVNRQVFEIKSANILQPGPAALTDGLDQLRDIIHNWAQQHG